MKKYNVLKSRISLHAITVPFRNVGKKLRYIAVLLIAAVLAGCNLLDIEPRQEMRQDAMFSHEDGYKEALIGVYIRIASADMYGRTMSFYLPELLAHNFARSEYPEAVENRIYAWDFTNSLVEPTVMLTWNAYYRAIAELNNILDNIDDDREIFRNGNYELIKGEALGLRAFLHLDLLRLFGPVPSAADDADAIPYAEVFSRDPDNYISLTHGEVKARILRDLDLAEQLLANDPLVGATLVQTQFGGTWEGQPVDTWQNKRQQRFNLYAVKAARARFHDWTGDRTNAVKYAQEVIATGKFRLTNAGDFQVTGDNMYAGEVDLVFFNEQIFAVHNPAHQTIVAPYFKGSDNRLTLAPADISTAYEGNASDIRNVKDRYWREQVEGTAGVKNHFLKYSGNTEIAAANKVPLLRLAEMYLIAIQNLDAGDARIDLLFKEYVDTRVLSQQLLGTLTDAAAIRDRMEREWRKEFLGEGQMFYFYKKHNYRHYTWPEAFNVPYAYADYRVPKPQGQIIFE